MHNKILKNSPWLLIALLVLSWGTGGCAAMRAASARQQVIKQRSMAYRFSNAKVPKSQTFAEIQSMVFADGYMMGSGIGFAGAYSFTTGWRRYRNGSRDRLMVQLVELDADAYQIRVQRSSLAAQVKTKPRSKSNRTWSTASAQTPTTVRDYTMEWSLIQRLDPQSAEEISNEADIKAQMARQKN